MELEKHSFEEATFEVRRLPGLTPYAEGWKLQRELVGLRRGGGIPDTLVLLDHSPVYTVGRAAKDASNLGAGTRPFTVRDSWWGTRFCASSCSTPTNT